MPFLYQKYNYETPSEIKESSQKLHNVLIVGAGPVGLTLALSMAKQGEKVIILDEKNQVGEGSRAICFAKRSLEVFEKLGVAQPMIELGVQWNVGRIFFRENEIHRFDLSPEKTSKFPAFINLQQYYVETFLIEAALKEPNIEFRWLNKVTSIEQNDSFTTLEIESPDGAYTLKTKYLAACDGSRSHIRQLMKLEMFGNRFEERFLIADFRMEADFPSERWFWFDPPFAKGQSILLHKQPDNIWRLDFKLGKNADPSIAQDYDFLKEKIKSVVGERLFELEWSSIYSFSSKKLEQFVHRRVIFVGDSAHVVSPFGARGANSGIEDADNLSWKLVEIFRGGNPNLLATYDAERTAAADQNIACTGETNTFIAPPSEKALQIRNEILENAATDDFAKSQINCGRLSVPSIYGKYKNSEQGAWNTPNLETGRAIKDCFFYEKKGEKTFLIEKLSYQFTLLISEKRFNTKAKNLLKLNNINILSIEKIQNDILLQTYDLTSEAAYLITPDQYILGRWKNVVIKDVLFLVETYLSGQVFEAATLQKSKQEIIDEQVATLLRTF